MLTSAGHGILLRSIIGTLPSAVTHMSFGVNWLDGQTVVDNQLLNRRELLGFEVLRVPVQVAYDHLTPLNAALNKKEDYQLIYKGELPINRRIAFNEIGLWQGNANTRYGENDSKLISTCDVSSGWKLTKEVTVDGTYDAPASSTDQLLSTPDYYNAIREEYYKVQSLKIGQPRIETTSIRLRPKLVAGTTTTRYLYKLPLSLDLSMYGPDDLFKVAFAWTPETRTDALYTTNFAATTVVNHKVQLTFTFAGTASPITKELTFLTTWTLDEKVMQSYIVKAIPLQELVSTANGQLKEITIELDYSNPPDTPTANSSLLLDGVRLDRFTANNPLYGLVFYDQVFDEVTYGEARHTFPIEKMSGFDGHMEHRVRLFANNSGEATV